MEVNSVLASMRSPIWAFEMPTTPSMGAVILVHERLSFACVNGRFRRGDGALLSRRATEWNHPTPFG